MARLTELEEMIRATNVAKRDMIEAAADSAIAACQAAGVMSIMPAPHMPTSGLVLFVHPEVYDRIQEKKGVRHG